MRKQKKRFIACILALTLAGGQLVPASAAGTDQMPAQEKTVGTVEETQENQETDLTDQGDMAESGENPDMDPAEDADAPDSVQDDTDSSQDDAGSTEEQDPEAGAGEEEAGKTGGETETLPDGEIPEDTDETTPDMDAEGQTEEAAEEEQDLLTQSLEEPVAGVSYQISGQSNMEKPVMDGAVAGRPGSGQRIEGISIKLYTKEGEEQPAGGIRYRAHVQNIGWMDWVSDDDYAGTKGQSLRMEAVQIELTGEIKEKYDVYYTTYVQNIGWLGWAKNGQSSGTEAFSRQVEAIRICLVEKGSEAPGENQGYFVKGLPSSALSATAHIQIYGDRTTTGSGKLIGTTGEKKRMEGLRLTIKGAGESGCPSGGIRYRAHVQNIGWQGWKQNGELAGTKGKSLRMEAIQIELTGELARYYDVYYSAHVQQLGWLGWAKNGESAGTEAFYYRMEAMKICLVKKGDPAPGTAGNAFCKGYSTGNLKYSGHVQNIGNTREVTNNQILGTVGKSLRMEALKIRLTNAAMNGRSGGIQYRAHVQNIGWQGWKQNGALAGTTGRALRMEAVQIQLTGEIAKYYDIYYRAHVQNFGWVGWAKNGQSAGTTGYGYRMEALQIQMVPKGGNAPANSGYYKQYTGKKSLNVPLTYQNPKYPNGCEAISLYMVLRYYGYMLTTNDVCNKYLPRGPLHSTNPYAAYMGNPGSLTGGYGCWAPVICQTAANYFKAVNVKNRSAKNITGTSLEGLFQYIDKGMPVVVWGTLNMGSTTWFRAGRKNGVTFYWPSRAHCVVLTGYDKNRKVVKVNDPIRGKVEYSFSSFEKAYRTMNRNAMVIQ